MLNPERGRAGSLRSSEIWYGAPAMEQNDEGGYRLSLVLFTVAIPIIGAIGAYLAAQMPY